MTYSEGRIANLTLTPSGGSSTPLISDIRYFPFGGPESWLLGPNQASSMAYLREIDLNSRIEKYSTPTGYRQLGFDDGGRIVSMKNCSTTTVPCPAGNLLWTNTYGYDTVGRLTSFNGSTSNGNAAANITQSQSFTYDANGNRLTAILNGTTSTYAYPGGATPTSNRLTSVTGGLVMTNTYDNAGNLTNDGTRSFVYDSRGRMTSATNAGTTTSYLIDYRNLRVKKSNASETKFFVYDDSGHMLGEYDGNGNPIQELFWLGDTPVALRGNMPCLSGGGCTETATAYVWTDHLNTPRELTRINASNQHVAIWKWDSLPFGETEPNGNPSNLGTMTFNHRFPGQYRDQETALNQNRYREYDARLGRYIESDPIGLGDGTNTYGYVRANPVRFVDSQGKAAETVFTGNNFEILCDWDRLNGAALQRLVTTNDVIFSFPGNIVTGAVLSSLISRALAACGINAPTALQAYSQYFLTSATARQVLTGLLINAGVRLSYVGASFVAGTVAGSYLGALGDVCEIRPKGF